MKSVSAKIRLSLCEKSRGDESETDIGSVFDFDFYDFVRGNG